MKPSNWNQLLMQEQKEYARKLLNSVRGIYIVGQALAVAIQTMKKKKHPETSNIEDMEMLGESLFHLGYSITNLNRGPLRKPKTKKAVKA